MNDTERLQAQLDVALEGIQSLRDVARDEDLLDELLVEWGFDSLAAFLDTRLGALLLEVESVATPEDSNFLERLAKGDRVALLRNVERGSSLFVRAGATGTVVQLPEGRSNCVLVKMDDPINDPDNIVQWAYESLDHIGQDLQVLPS